MNNRLDIFVNICMKNRGHLRENALLNLEQYTESDGELSCCLLQDGVLVVCDGNAKSERPKGPPARSAWAYEGSLPLVSGGGEGFRTDQ
jgi:hypothetical protein